MIVVYGSHHPSALAPGATSKVEAWSQLAWQLVTVGRFGSLNER